MQNDDIEGNRKDPYQFSHQLRPVSTVTASNLPMRSRTAQAQAACDRAPIHGRIKITFGMGHLGVAQLSPKTRKLIGKLSRSEQNIRCSKKETPNSSSQAKPQRRDLRNK
jgi:hypothetical protein